MKKVILAATLAVVPALFVPSFAKAQTTPNYGTEVCVNASAADEAKRLFPNAKIHVIPDFANSNMNGWRVVTGAVDSNGRIHTDAEEIALRVKERLHDTSIRGE